MIVHKVAVAYIFFDKEVLTVKSTKDDSIDAIGVRIDDDKDPKLGLTEKLQMITGQDYSNSLKASGYIKELIHKKNEDVELLVKVFSFRLDKKPSIDKEQYAWQDVYRLKEDLYAKRIWRNVIAFYEAEGHIAVSSEENQYGSWLEAELLSWTIDKT